MPFLNSLLCISFTTLEKLMNTVAVLMLMIASVGSYWKSAAWSHNFERARTSLSHSCKWLFQFYQSFANFAKISPPSPKPLPNTTGFQMLGPKSGCRKFKNWCLVILKKLKCKQHWVRFYWPAISVTSKFPEKTSGNQWSPSLCSSSDGSVAFSPGCRAVV